MSTLTAGQLNRATLDRQLLLDRVDISAVDAVHRIFAVQAQEAASPYLALWNRVRDFDAADLDRAYAEHDVVKATLLRVTLHAVTAADYPVVHRAMRGTLRGARLYDARFTRTGLSLDEADALVPRLLDFCAQPRTNAELEAYVDELVGERPKPGVWWALRHTAPFVHAVTGPPWSFGPRPAFLASPHPAYDGDTAMQQLTRRYLAAFGPATYQDVARFGMLGAKGVRDALEARDDLVRYESPTGAVLYDLPDAALPDPDAPAPPRLMAMWDNVVLAYADRSRIVPDEYRRIVGRANGDTLATLLVDGHVAGVWRPVEGGIEASAFHPLDHGTWDGLAAEAAALVAFLADRQPDVYRRYGRWWTDLPYAERRVLPG